MTATVITRMRASVARADRWAVGALAVAATPIVVAAARAINSGWVPIGDDALVQIRAGDVFTANNPLLGTWTSASVDAGVNMNHPGPLLFDALAAPVRVFGGHAGVVIGVMLVNLLAATTVAVFAFRIGGRRGCVAGLAAFTYLAWIMGSQLLFDPWNPHVLMLPCVALLVTAASISIGDWWALPVYLAIGSFCVQTHVGYVYFVPGILIVAIVGWMVLRRAGRPASKQQAAPYAPVADDRDTAASADIAASADTPAPADTERSRNWPRPVILVASVATFFVLWAQPLWEQMFGAGEGNLSRLASGAGSSGLRISWRLALRIVASVVGRAPWTARSGLENAVPNTPYSSPGVLGAVHNLSGWAAAARLVLLVAILVAAVWLAWRRRDRRALAMMVVGIGGLLIAAATLLVMPIGPFGLTAHQMRWLWSLTAYLWFAVLMTFAGLAAERFSLKVTAAFVAVLALLAAATVPTFVQPLGPAGRAVEGPVVAELDRQMSKLQGIGTVLFDTRNTPVLDNYSAAVMAELQQLAIPFKVDDEGLVRQLGDRRRYLDDADVRMYLLYGKDALTVPAGDDRVALATPLNGAEQSELQALMTADPTAAEPSSRYTELLDMVYAGTTVAVIIAPL